MRPGALAFHISRGWKKARSQELTGKLRKLCRLFHGLEGGMKSQNLHAIVVGGGIAGPALALLLKKAGLTSTIYEAHPRLEDVGDEFTIAPNGMNVL